MSSWATKRQLLYFGLVIIIAIILGLLIFIPILNRPPTCFDNRHNGKEEGVDCGGNCSTLCADLVTPLRVVYARPFVLEGNEWSVIARVENSNQRGYATDVPYSVRIVDDGGSLIAERRGVVNVAPAQARYILESRISVGSRTPARAYITLEEPREWLPHTVAQVPPVQVTKDLLIDRGGLYRVTAQVVNPTFTDLKDVVAVVVVFDTQGVARAASETVVRVLQRESSADVVFTWPTAFDFTPARIEVVAYPSL
jgi:hypothetical protein